MLFTGFRLSINKPEKTVPFYTEVLGMRLCSTVESDVDIVYALSFGNARSRIELVYRKADQAGSYQLGKRDNYWKFSLFVEDIQQTCQWIRDSGCSIGEPYQLGRIGYLAHTTDPEGHAIELIQKTFQDSPRHYGPADPVLGLLTLRTADPVKSIRLFEDILDLKLFVRMEVDHGQGFTLYFLGDRNMTSPSGDMDAIANREWMYQQEHLFVELQHYWESGPSADFMLETTGPYALQHLSFVGNLDDVTQLLTAHSIACEKVTDGIGFQTADGQRVMVYGTGHSQLDTSRIS